MEDMTDATGQQVIDDIFEESRLRRVDLPADVEPGDLETMDLPADPFVGFYAGPIRVGDAEQPGETLVVASASQRRRYLLKRYGGRRAFRVWQSTPVPGEKLRLLNVYRVMTGKAVDPPG